MMKGIVNKLWVAAQLHGVFLMDVTCILLEQQKIGSNCHA